MLELAKQGARWLRDYEGWGVGPSATIVEEGQEPPEMLRHLDRPRSDAREVCRISVAEMSPIFFNRFLGLRAGLSRWHGVPPLVLVSQRNIVR